MGLFKAIAKACGFGGSRVPDDDLVKRFKKGGLVFLDLSHLDEAVQLQRESMGLAHRKEYDKAFGTVERIIVGGIRCASSQFKQDRLIVVVKDEEMCKELGAQGVKCCLVYDADAELADEGLEGDLYVGDGTLFRAIQETKADYVVGHVNYNVEGNKTYNYKLADNLSRVAEFCKLKSSCTFIVHLVVHPTSSQRALFGFDSQKDGLKRFSSQLLPSLTVSAVRQLLDSEVMPRGWVIDNLSAVEKLSEFSLTSMTNVGALILGTMGNVDLPSEARQVSQQDKVIGFTMRFVSFWKGILPFLNGVVEEEHAREVVSDHIVHLVEKWVAYQNDEATETGSVASETPSSILANSVGGVDIAAGASRPNGGTPTSEIKKKSDELAEKYFQERDVGKTSTGEKSVNTPDPIQSPPVEKTSDNHGKRSSMTPEEMAMLRERSGSVRDAINRIQSNSVAASTK